MKTRKTNKGWSGINPLSSFDYPPLKKRANSHSPFFGFTHQFKERPSIKDTIEALGIPHPEVYCILVNDKAVDFAYKICDGDRVNVYPISAATNIAPIIQLQPPIPEVPIFILDVHLGKLASSLRMLGFDTLYRNDYEDPEIAKISANENRIVLTRDRGVLMRSLVTYGYYVRSTKPERQIVEVLQRFQLVDRVQPFHRCIRCNGTLISVDKQSIVDRLPLETKRCIDTYYCCSDCQQIYWQGTHFQRMEQFVEQVLKRGANF
ncbi:MAG: Mut7-C RNAse domain-containing protein [Xenococcaceae cyanobacterium]